MTKTEKGYYEIDSVDDIRLCFVESLEIYLIVGIEFRRDAFTKEIYVNKIYYRSYGLDADTWSDDSPNVPNKKFVGTYEDAKEFVKREKIAKLKKEIELLEEG